MASFTRKMLKELGLEEEAIQKVIEAHLDVVNSLKDERDELKEKASKADELQKQLDGMKNEGWKEKAEKVEKELDSLKNKIKAESDMAKLKEAYRALLVNENVSEKWIDRVMDGAKFSEMKLDKDGKLENVDDLTKDLKSKWSDVITTTSTKGASVDNPPEINTSKKTMAEIYKKDESGRYVLSTAERQKAIAENLASVR